MAMINYKNKICIIYLFLLFIFSCENKKSTKIQKVQENNDSISMAKEILHKPDSLRGSFYCPILWNVCIYDSYKNDSIFKKSEFWSDNHNRFNPTMKENPMPSKIEIINTITAPFKIWDFFSQQTKVKIKVVLQMKLGLNDDCVFVVNPVESGEYLLFEKELYKKDLISEEGTKRIKVKTIFPIKQKLKDILDDLYSTKKEKEIAKKYHMQRPFLLNQIIIKMYIVMPENEHALEYIHYICEKSNGKF